MTAAVGPKPQKYQVTLKHDKGTTKLIVKATSSQEAARLAQDKLPRGAHFIYNADAVELTRLGGKHARTVYMLKVITSSQTTNNRVDKLIISAAGKRPYTNETGLAERALSFIYGGRDEAHVAKKRVERLKIKNLEAAVKKLRVQGEGKILNSRLSLIREVIRTELKNLLD